MHPSTSTSQLWLSPHVRACEIDGQVILLNLASNRYLGVGAASAKALAGEVKGWPIGPDASEPSPPPHASLRGSKQLLVSQGLLTDKPQAELAMPVTVEAKRSLDIDEESMKQKIGALRLGHLLLGATVTAFRLKYCSLQTMVKAVNTRRGRIQCNRLDSVDAMRRGTAAYLKLRPFLFTARENCLYDSLTLLSFLASEGVFPKWVIGVKTCPFGAHSWVQSGDTVLNDQHEYVRRFRPILFV